MKPLFSMGGPYEELLPMEHPFESDITNLQLNAYSSLKLSNDVSALELFEDGEIVDMGMVMENPIYLLDSGMALQLIHPTGMVADTIVYKMAPWKAKVGVGFSFRASKWN